MNEIFQGTWYLGFKTKKTKNKCLVKNHIVNKGIFYTKQHWLPMSTGEKNPAFYFVLKGLFSLVNYIIHKK